MPYCCSDSGAEEKLYRCLNGLEDERDRVDIELSTVLALDATKKILTGNGGCDNSYTEWMFSICRMLGLRPELC